VTFDNDALRKTLLSRDITTSTTTPSFIRSFYSARALHPSSHPSISSNHTNAKALLLYSISDLPSTSSYTELSDLPFIPLADSKSLGTFCALPKADSSHLVQLESMGFTKFLALHALRKFRNKLDPAIEWLFEVRRGCKRAATGAVSFMTQHANPHYSSLRSSPLPLLVRSTATRPPPR